MNALKITTVEKFGGDHPAYGVVLAKVEGGQG
jgi:hypothetical protein